MPARRPFASHRQRMVILISLLCVLTSASADRGSGSEPANAPGGERRAPDALQAALLALDPARARSEPGSPADPAAHPSGALRDLALALPGLEGAERRRALDLLRRPTPGAGAAQVRFAGESSDSPLCDAAFCVHWTESGRDAPVTPRFVGNVVAAMRRSVAVENVQLGWRAAKPDGKRGAHDGVGGEGQVDVYVMELGRSIYGYAAPDPGQSGMRRSGYLVIDNDYAGFGAVPVDAIQATIAHEYNHVLQLGYDAYQDLWLFEATAVWMEEMVYPDLDDYIGYLRAFAARTGKPMTGEGMKIYGLGVWNHWLAARHGPELIRQVWELSPESRHFAVAAYERALARSGGTSFGREFANFAIAGAEWSASSEFPDAARYPPIERRRTLRRAGRGGRITLDNTSYELIDVDARRRNLRLVVRTRRGVRAALALVGRRGGRSRGEIRKAVRFLPRGGRASVRLGHAHRYDRITAVIVNADGRPAGWGRGGRRLYHSDDTRFHYRLAR